MVTVGTAVVPALAFLSQLAAAFLWTESRCARHVSCTQLRHRRLPSSWSLVCATVNFWNSFLHIAKITCNMDMDTNMCVCVCVCVCCAILSCFSRVRLFVTVWTVAHQAPLSMGFSRQEYWSGLPRPPPGDLSIPGIESCLLHLLHCRWILYHSASREAPMYVHVYIY